MLPLADDVVAPGDEYGHAEAARVGLGHEVRAPLAGRVGVVWPECAVLRGGRSVVPSVAVDLVGADDEYARELPVDAAAPEERARVLHGVGGELERVLHRMS